MLSETAYFLPMTSSVKEKYVCKTERYETVKRGRPPLRKGVGKMVDQRVLRIEKTEKKERLRVHSLINRCCLFSGCFKIYWNTVALQYCIGFYCRTK